MKKKILLLLGFSLVLVSAVWAQDKVVSGQVTSSDDGSTLPGVNVVLKGTSNGAVTDADGNYRLTVPGDGGTLVFSFIGLTSQEVEIGQRTSLNVVMTADVKQLSEVVVTALGIERNKNELPYAAQSVGTDQILQARNNNFVNSLSGRVSGLDVKTNNTMGGSTNVVIRGMKSITGNNQALFVIDGVPVSNANQNTAVNSTQSAGGGGPDYGNAASDINPDNIASVNVLKGAAATALYGSRGTNGVIMITTKSGQKKSFGVTINSGVMWGNINKATFPTYQKQYGAGYEDYFYNYTGLDGPGIATRFDDDASFGHKFDGQPVYQWAALDPFSPTYGHTTPWVAAANDPSTFYETSVSSNQSILITGGGDNATYKFGYTRMDEKGILPNSTLDKNMITFSASMDIAKNLKLTSSMNYTRVDGVGRYGTGYSGLNPNQGFRQWWQQNVDIKEQREAYFRNGKNVTWNWASTAGTGPIFADNAYWDRYQNYNNDSRDNLFGYAMLDYKIADWITVTGRAGMNLTSDFIEQRVAVGSAGTSSYTRFNQTSTERNFDLYANINKSITQDISFRAVLGANMRRNENSSIRGATVSGLIVPNLYTLANSAGAVVPAETLTKVGVDGMYINTTFGYKDIAYIEASVRQDKSTTLPSGNNSYVYGSLGGTFAYSALMKNTSWLSSGKIRANYATVGNDAPALSIYNVYDKPATFGTTTLFSLPNTRNNALLKPERTATWEVGLEAAFMDERVGFDVTHYEASTTDQILPVTVSASTGYTAAFVNSGEVQNKGWEVSLFAVPIKTADFSWTINVNYTRNRNKVISLYGEGSGEVTNVQIASFQGSVSVNAAKGEPYGVLKGRDFLYTNGQRTIDANGYYMRGASSADIIGNPNPDWLGGLNNTFKYKAIKLNFLIDTRQGGDLFSLDMWYGDNTGQYPNSAGLNARGVEARLPKAQGGGVLLEGVQIDGSPNTVYAENFDANGNNPFGYYANQGLSAVNKAYVYSSSYIKLREVNLTYSLPKTLLAKLGGIKGIDVSLIGRNLFVIKDLPYSDPEDALSSGNANMGYQSGAYPSTRQYGFNVKLNF